MTVDASFLATNAIEPRLEVTPVRGCKLESTLNATTYNSINDMFQTSHNVIDG